MTDTLCCDCNCHLMSIKPCGKCDEFCFVKTTPDTKPVEKDGATPIDEIRNQYIDNVENQIPVMFSVDKGIGMDMTMTVTHVFSKAARRPWKLLMNMIVDADGNAMYAKLDGSYWPGTRDGDTAALIVEAVNAYDSLKARLDRLENFVRYYGRLTIDEVTDREIAGNLQSKAKALAPTVGEKETL